MDHLNDAICRFCKEEEPTSVDVLYHCEGLAMIKSLVLGIESSTAH